MSADPHEPDSGAATPADPASLLGRAESWARMLRRGNIAVAAVAVAVYLVMSGILLFYAAWLPFVFITCLLLGVLLASLFVATVLAHLDLYRAQAHRER